jgi:hypothetical protein
MKAASRRYEQAVKICFSERRRYTIVAIGLAVLAEYAAMLYRYGSDEKAAQQEYQRLAKEYEALMALELPPEMKGFFAGWGAVIDEVKEEKDKEKKYEMLFGLARKVAY